MLRISLLVGDSLPPVCYSVEGGAIASLLLQYKEDGELKEVTLPKHQTDFYGLNSYIIKPDNGTGIYLLAEEGKGLFLEQSRLVDKWILSVF